MAKKDKKKKDTKGSDATDALEAVRGAVERALPEGSKARGREIVDEVARAVVRVRASLEEHRVLDDLRGLRGEIESLARRVGALESRDTKTTSATTSASGAASRPAAAKTRSTASRA